MMQAIIKEWWRELVRDKNSFYTTCLLAAAVVGFGSWKGYGWYVERREQSAQLAMAEALEEYYKAFSSIMLGKDSQEVVGQRIDDARIAFETVLARHGNANTACYAHAFDADIAWYAGEKERALISMQRAVDRASVPSVRDMFKTKYALMLLDSENSEKGLEILSTLAHDPKNRVADYAAYYLGYYHWIKGNAQAARDAWAVLETFASDARPEGTSPWLKSAQGKLAQIS